MNVFILTRQSSSKMTPVGAVVSCLHRNFISIEAGIFTLERNAIIVESGATIKSPERQGKIDPL